MKTIVDNSIGREIHRIQTFENYDPKRFQAIYKIVKPYINKLASGIDVNRYRVDSSIIKSYFMDKALYVFMKYQDQYDDEHLKATILSSLSIFRNKLLRGAYGAQADFYQTTASLDDTLRDLGNREIKEEDDTDTSSIDWEDEDTSYKEDLSIRFNEYLRSKLTEDEYILFRTELELPPFLEERKSRNRGKVSIYDLIEFFELPKTKKSATLISEMRKSIKAALTMAKTEFKCR